jgi:hypothetical protein
VAERDPAPLEGFTAELFHVADAAPDAASATGGIVQDEDGAEEAYTSRLVAVTDNES